MLLLRVGGVRLLLAVSPVLGEGAWPRTNRREGHGARCRAHFECFAISRRVHPALHLSCGSAIDRFSGGIRLPILESDEPSGLEVP